MQRSRNFVGAPVVAPPVGVHDRKQVIAERGLIRTVEKLVDVEPSPEGPGPPMLPPLLGVRPAVGQRASVGRGLVREPGSDEQGDDRDERHERSDSRTIAAKEPVQREAEDGRREHGERPRSRQGREAEQEARRSTDPPPETVSSKRARDHVEAADCKDGRERLRMVERARPHEHWCRRREQEGEERSARAFGEEFPCEGIRQQGDHEHEGGVEQLDGPLRRIEAQQIADLLEHSRDGVEERRVVPDVGLGHAGQPVLVDEDLRVLRACGRVVAPKPRVVEGVPDEDGAECGKDARGDQPRFPFLPDHSCLSTRLPPRL